MRVRLSFSGCTDHAWLESSASELCGELSRCLLVLLTLMFLADPARPQSKAEELSKLNIEALMNIEVTSVSKKEQKISPVATAIFAITQKAIPRSGATNVPDLLRTVPGVDVAQINAIRRTMKPEDLRVCQIIFISDAERGRLAEVFESLKRSSVLAVGESDGFAQRGGCIQFYLEASKVRFSINVDAVQRARLTVSSKLLALARIVHDEGHPKGG